MDNKGKHNDKDINDHDFDKTEPSHLARWPAPGLDPDVYLSLTPTPEDMKPIFNLSVRMCIGFYDKEGAVYDYQGVLTEYSISRTHPYYKEDVSSTTLHDFSQEDWFPLLDAQHYIPKIILVHVIKNGIKSKDPNNYGFGLMYKMYTAIVFRYGQAMMVTVLVNERTWEIRHFQVMEPHNLDEKISQWAYEYNQNTVFQRPYIKDIKQYKKDVHATCFVKYDCQEYTDWQWVEKE